MNKNTTDITLSAYFNDIVIGYYEDENLVKQFGRQLGFDVDMDKLWLTVYATSHAQIESCNDWMSTHRTGCFTA